MQGGVAWEPILRCLLQFPPWWGSGCLSRRALAGGQRSHLPLKLQPASPGGRSSLEAGASLQTSTGQFDCCHTAPHWISRHVSDHQYSIIEHQSFVGDFGLSAKKLPSKIWSCILFKLYQVFSCTNFSGGELVCHVSTVLAGGLVQKWTPSPPDPTKTDPTSKENLGGRKSG